MYRIKELRIAPPSNLGTNAAPFLESKRANSYFSFFHLNCFLCSKSSLFHNYHEPCTFIGAGLEQ